uniref:Odorant binding protein 6 n=1 Tax=Xylotrechus quadripes TaxID=554073 RepID=A0A346HGM8_9CUCU|nr:odorant binding protein 6 [Xylotrechus quadripes]
MFNKILVFLVGCYLPHIMALSKEEMKDLAQQLHNTCVTQTGVSEDLIKAVNNDGTFSDDENFKCYTKCIMQESGIMDDEGLVDVEAAVAMLPEEYKDFEAIIRDCGTKKGSTACENAWLTQKCYSQHPRYHLV